MRGGGGAGQLGISSRIQLAHVLPGEPGTARLL
jgi:hypothetical protein